MAHDNFGCGSGDGSVSRTAINTGPDGAAIPIFPAGSPPGSEVPVTTGTPDDPVTTGAPDGNLVGREIAYQAFLRATDGLAVLDSGVIICCNDALCAFLGHSREHLSGRPLTLFAPPRQAGGRSTAEALDQLLQRCLEGSPAVDAWCFCRPDGQPVQGELGLSSLGPGGPTLVAIRDTTARTRGEDTLRRRRAIFEAVSFMAERLFRTSTWTEELGPVLDSLGRAAEADAVTLWRIEPELKGRTEVTLWGAWPGHLNPAGRPIRSWSIDRSPLYDLLRVRLRSGEAIEWEHGRLPIELLEPEQKAGDLPVEAAPRARDGRGNAAGIRPRLVVPLFVESCLWGTLVFTFPESRGQINQPESEAMQLAAKILGAGIDRTAADEQLRSATEAMERATVYAKEMATEAMMASSAKSRFLAAMSHEIRTPINGITGMTELALATPLSTQQRNYLNAVKQSANALLTLLNDILDFSKIEAGRMELEKIPFRLRDVVGDAVQVLAVPASQKGLELVYRVAPDAPEQVLGDPGRLRQILVNLVGNAIKFTERGEVVVDVRGESPTTDAALLHFAVRDTGIGIPAEKRDCIFEAFRQCDSSTTRRFGGTGLGLTISAQIVHLLGGRMWVESEVGQGSTFHFAVPLHLDPAATREEDLPAPLRHTPVLVVAPHAAARRAYCDALEGYGLKTTAVDNPATALHALRAAVAADAPFRVALVDVGTAHPAFWNLAEEIRRREGPEMCPVVLMLPAGLPDGPERAGQRGIGRHAIKPPKPRELLNLVLAALQSSPAAPSPPESCDGRGPARRLHVLLADDAPVNQEVAAGLLELRGHSVEVVGNGREALDALGRRPFDVVLLDIEMPGMDGLEATAAIRAIEETTGRHTPIIAMTAHALKGFRERCIEAGMDGYVSKPIQPAELYEAIESAAARAPGSAAGPRA